MTRTAEGAVPSGHPKRRWQSSRMRLAVNQDLRARWCKSIPAHTSSRQRICRGASEAQLSGSTLDGKAKGW